MKVGIAKAMQDDVRKLRRWQQANSEGNFTIPSTAADLNVEPRRMNAILRHVQNVFKKFYTEQDERGLLHGSPTQKWMVAIVNFEREFGITPLFYDHLERTWDLPEFSRKQENSAKRVDHWVKAATTVVIEMEVYDETFLITGKKPRELLAGLSRTQQQITNGENALKCSTCGDLLEPQWVICPTCAQPIKE